VQILAKIKAFLSTPLFNNIRAMVYVAVPAVLLELVREGRISQDNATLWTAVVVAASGPALAAIFAPNGWRTYLSSLLIPVQGLLVGLGGATHTWLLLGAAVVGSFISSGIWAANVHTIGTADAAHGGE